jgi:Polyketide cyclase / dehydrase and lipid transport
MRRRRSLVAVATLGLAAKAYDLLVEGALTLDTGVGRRVQPLGPVSWEIAAPRERVFELIESPYRRTPRALQHKLQVWERGSDMVLAAHVTQVGRRRVTTVETVRFERPDRIHFRLVRGPVPHLAEAFELEETESGTRLTWSGELGTDFGPIGERWGRIVARAWARAVAQSIGTVKSEAERQPRRL